MRNSGWILAAAAVGSTLLSSCGSARRSEPLNGAVNISDPRVERGRFVYMANCNHCHPGGEAGLGPALNDKPLPEFLLKTQIRTGLGAMPSFSETETLRRGCPCGDRVFEADPRG